MPVNEIKKIYIAGIGGVVVLLLITFGILSFFYTRSNRSEQYTNPFPLDDGDATYILSQVNNNYTLMYTKATGETHEIYVDSISIQPYKEYLGRPIRIKGYMKTTYKTVQCIKAPCDPVRTDIFVITDVDNEGY